MTTRKDPPDSFHDIEKPHPLVTDSPGDASQVPLTVRLGDLWDDFLPVEREGQRRSASALPLLDHMKGILQWD
jgi:hypothetical protein